MKYFFSFFLCVFLLMLGCADKEKKPSNESLKKSSLPKEEGIVVELNLEKSKIFWIGKKITSEHSGELFLKSGVLQMNNDKVVSGTFIIDMNTLKNTDIENPKKKGYLEDHLKSEDFFSVEKYQEAIFLLTSASISGENEYTFKGDLTIKSITHPISFPAVVNKNVDGTFSANANIEIDRTLWDIRYRSGKFFQDLGDKLILDLIELRLELSTI